MFSSVLLASRVLARSCQVLLLDVWLSCTIGIFRVLGFRTKYDFLIAFADWGSTASFLAFECNSLLVDT